jgi:hypothetical protein
MRGRVMRGRMTCRPAVRGPVHGHFTRDHGACCGDSPRALFRAIAAAHAYAATVAERAMVRASGTPALRASAPVTTIHSQSEAHCHSDLDSDLHSVGESGM